MESIITYEEVLERVTKVVDERGRDYVYDDHQGDTEECRYFVDGRPSCIVGHLIHGLGDEEFEREVREHELRSGSFPASMLNLQGEARFDEDALRFLQEAQRHQDRGLPWGRALDMAIDYMESGSI